jgi:choice-of-anchor C domain-containing protein
MLRYVLAMVFLAVGSPAFASSILINGSFELGPPPFSFHDIDIPPGSTDITGWVVTGNGIDLLEDPWDVSDGIRAIDLDGRSPGGIEQTFATLLGQLYAVSFDVSGNPQGGSLLKPLRVSVGGVSNDYTFDATGLSTIDALVWQPVFFSFVAPAGSATLSFASLSASGSYGALIDNVQVTPVPEPTTLALVLAGIAAAGRRVRRK